MKTVALILQRVNVHCSSKTAKEKRENQGIDEGARNVGLRSPLLLSSSILIMKPIMCSQQLVESITLLTLLNISHFVFCLTAILFLQPGDFSHDKWLRG